MSNGMKLLLGTEQVEFLYKLLLIRKVVYAKMWHEFIITMYDYVYIITECIS